MGEWLSRRKVTASGHASILYDRISPVPPNQPWSPLPWGFIGHLWGPFKAAGQGAVRWHSLVAEPAQHPEVAWSESTYATTIQEYNSVLRRFQTEDKAHLVRDVYEDLLMDGCVPNRHTFHFAIVACKHSRRLQDVLYFVDEMKSQGLIPDLILYNCIISACGLSRQAHLAFKVAEELELNGLQPNVRTYVALLSACGNAGRPEEALAVLQRMEAQGITPNVHCYAALITAYKNKRPYSAEYKNKVLDLLLASNSAPLNDDAAEAGAPKALHSSKEAGGEAGAAGSGVPDAFRTREGTEADSGASQTRVPESQQPLEEEEDGGLEIQSDQGLNESASGSGAAEEEGGEESEGARFGQVRWQAAYRAALRAMAEWRDVEGAERVIQMAKEAGLDPDLYSQVLILRVYLTNGTFSKAHAAHNQILASGRRLGAAVQISMIEGAIREYTPECMDIAKKLLTIFEEQGLFLSTRVGGVLLYQASRERPGHGDFSCATAIFNHILANSSAPRLIVPDHQAVKAYVSNLVKRGASKDDPRLKAAAQLLREPKEKWR